MAGKRGIRKVALSLPRQGNVPIFTSAGVEATMRRLLDEATLYGGVKLMQAFEAVYLQGRKDGARATFEQIESSVTQVKQLIPHKNPGRTKSLTTPKSKSATSPKRKVRRRKRRRKVAGGTSA